MNPRICNITWSSEAAIPTPDGGIWSAFASNSYAARVKFDDDTSVIVLLPKDAARFNTSAWVRRVQKVAELGRQHDKPLMTVLSS